MGKLITGLEYKTKYGRGYAFLTGSELPKVNNDLSYANNLLVVGGYNNPKAYNSNSLAQRIANTDNVYHLPTALDLICASSPEVPSYNYCVSDSSYNLLLEKDIVSASPYMGNSGNIGPYDATKVYGYNRDNVFKVTGVPGNYTTTNLTMTELLTDKGESYPEGTYYYLLFNSYYKLCLGIRVHAIKYSDYSRSNYPWDYLYMDEPNDIYSNLSYYTLLKFLHSNVLPSESINISMDNIALNTTVAHGQYYYDKRLNNNSYSLHLRYHYNLGDLLELEGCDLLALTIIASNIYIPSFTHMNGTLAELRNNHTLGLMTPGIAYYDNKKDTAGNHTFNILPYYVDSSSLGLSTTSSSYQEVFGIKRTTSTTYDYIIGTRTVYGLFYVIPLLGGNTSNKFEIATDLSRTNNAIGAIMHKYGNASGWTF